MSYHEFEWPDGRKMGTVDFTPAGPVRQPQPEPKSDGKVTISMVVSFEVNVAEWARDYGLKPEEVTADVKEYLKTYLAEPHEEIRGTVQ